MLEMRIFFQVIQNGLCDRMEVSKWIMSWRLEEHYKKVDGEVNKQGDDWYHYTSIHLLRFEIYQFIKLNYKIMNRQTTSSTQYELTTSHKSFFDAPMKILLAVVLLTVYLHSYYTAPADLLVIDKLSFELVKTAYPLTSMEKLSVYIPNASFYNHYPADQWLYQSQYLPESWRYNLFHGGKMIQELQAWSLVNFKQGHYLFYWTDGISLTIILLAQKCKSLGQGSIRIVVPLNHPKQSEIAFRQSLIRNDLESYVEILQDEPALFESENKGDWIIVPGELLHEQIFNKYWGNDDPLDVKVQKGVSQQFRDDYAKCRWVLYYRHSFRSSQLHQLSLINQQLRVILSSPDGRYREMSLKDYQSEKHSNKFNLLFINNITIHKDQEPQIAQTQVQQEKQAEQKETEDEEDKMQVIPFMKITHHSVKRIKRISPKQVQSSLKCGQSTKPENVQLGGYFQSMFRGISLIRQQILYPEQIADLSHFGKFLMSYLQASELSSIFYAMEQQQPANIIALINDGNILLPEKMLKNGATIIQSLEHNGLNKHLIKLGYEWVEDKLLSQVLESNQIKVTFATLQFLAQWGSDIENQIRVGMDLILSMKGNMNEKEMALSFRQKGMRVFIILRRQQKDYDLGCIGDFQLEPFQKDKVYPLYSFYLITASDITMDPIDPINYQGSKINRNMKIFPYACAEPPYKVDHGSQQITGRVLVDTKYGYKLWVPKQKAYEFEMNGVEEEPLIEFINSCFVSKDNVFVHSEATQSQLILMALMKKLQGYGSLIVSQMTEEQEKLIDTNVELNAVSTVYEVIEITSSSVQSVRQYYFVSQPSVIFTTPEILKQQLQKPIELNKKALFIFKYNEVGAFENTLTYLMNTFTLYEIVRAQTNQQVEGQCLDYELKTLRKDNFKEHRVGWFIVVI